MFNLDDIINKQNEEHYLKCPYIPNHLHRMLIIGGSVSGKTNALLNLIKAKTVAVLLTRFIYMLRT